MDNQIESNIMKYLDLQRYLFNHSPSRLELVEYISTNSYPLYTVFICRNHSFEFVEHTIRAYLDYAQISVRFEYSDYDDSLTFLNININADMVLLWIDCSRYQFDDIEDFIRERIKYLQGIFKKSILIAPLNAENIDFSDTGIYTVNLKKIKYQLGDKYLDKRLEKFSGTKLSSKALLEISKILSLQYFSVFFAKPVKAIAIDLDNTIYQGVLGEDGEKGIVLTKDHRYLQQYIFDLSVKGIFICAISKNDIKDVKSLFETHKEFPLKFDVFSKIFASWESKSKSIKKMIRFLNIHEESIVFIDDNIGEVIEVGSAYPEIKVIHASADATITKTMLEYFPGLYRFNRHTEDLLRSNDIRANEKRSVLRRSLSFDEYIKNLHIQLNYKINNHNDVSRISELANKTNQFILAYKRYSTTEILECMKNNNIVVVGMYMRDKLSDSGLIGACVLAKNNNSAILEELFISCRALGRGIDDILILTAIKIALDSLEVNKLKIIFIKGERNKPAELFVDKYLTSYINRDNTFIYQAAKNLVEVHVEG